MPRPINEPLFPARSIWWSLLQGSLLLIAVGAVAWYGPAYGLDAAQTRALTVVSLVMGLIALILVNRPTSLAKAILRPNRALMVVALVSGAMLAVTQLWPPARSLFGFAKIPGLWWAVPPVLALGLLIVLEAIKAVWARLAGGNTGQQLSEQRIHAIFRVSIILKGLHALIEIVGGLAFYLVDARSVLVWVNRLTQNELVEDPRDFVATHLVTAAEQFTGATLSFYALYLVSHGLIKLVLVAGLLREKAAAYPASLAALLGFVVYQLYRHSYTHSAGLLVLTLFDVVVMGLVWHEWRVMRAHGVTPRPD